MKQAKSFNYPDIRKYKLTPGEEGLRLLVRIYKSNAKKKGREFSLTEDEFKALTSSSCHYCGQPPQAESFNRGIKHEEGRNRGKYVYNGVDRKDPSKGYSLENSVTCCHKCNTAKMDMSYEEFISYIECLASFRRSC